MGTCALGWPCGGGGRRPWRNKGWRVHAAGWVGGRARGGGVKRVTAMAGGVGRQIGRWMGWTEKKGAATRGLPALKLVTDSSSARSAPLATRACACACMHTHHRPEERPCCAGQGMHVFFPSDKKKEQSMYCGPPVARRTVHLGLQCQKSELRDTLLYPLPHWHGGISRLHMRLFFPHNVTGNVHIPADFKEITRSWRFSCICTCFVRAFQVQQSRPESYLPLLSQQCGGTTAKF